MQKSGTLHLNSNWTLSYRLLPEDRICLITSTEQFLRSEESVQIANAYHPDVSPNLLRLPVTCQVSCHVLTSQVIAWQNGSKADPVKMMTQYQESEVSDFGRRDRFFHLKIDALGWFQVTGRYPTQTETAQYWDKPGPPMMAYQFGGADVGFFRLEKDGKIWEIVDNIYHFHFKTWMENCAFDKFKDTVETYRIRGGRWMQSFQARNSDLDFDRLARVEFE